MPNLIRNADGTTQVAPPMQSAFAQPGGPPLAPQAPGPQQTAPNPGFSGAIMDLIKSLVSSFAPKGLTQAKPRTNEEIDRQSGGLGNDISP
jgi:hypothetical protein